MVSIHKLRRIFSTNTEGVDAPRNAARTRLETPLAPVELPRTHRLDAEPPPTSSSWIKRVGDLFRRNKPAVAAALAGATVIPGMAGAALGQTLDVTVPVVPNDPLGTARLDAARPAQVNPFTQVATAEGKFDLLKTKAAELEDRARNLTAVELRSAREKLLNDYIAGGGTIGVAPDAHGVSVAKRIAFAEPTREIKPANVTEFGMWKYFWETDGDAGMGLARRGLDEVTPEGVQKLVEYARTHEVDGTKKKPGMERIDPDQRAVARAILDHSHYGAFFELDARLPFYQAFGIDPGSVHIPHDALRPVKIGDVDIPKVSNAGTTLSMIAKTELAGRMSAEYQARRAFFEDPAVSEDVRGLRTLGLLQAYSDALWSSGERRETEEAGNMLLDAYFQLPYAGVHGNKDYNGAGFGVAQSLVLGLDVNSFEKRFPDAGPTAKTTYLAMHGEMVEAMKYVDQVREAFGLPKAAQDFEKKSPLGWMLGIESGHTKAGNLDEKKPFSSSGLNFGILLFPGDAEVANLPVKAGFEFPMDIIDGFNNAVVARPAWGDHLEVRDERGNALNVIKEIQRDGNGNAVSWSAKFEDAQGRAVDPSKVLGVIVNAGGEIKGDGRASRTLDMWWWGFCDRNTAQRLYKSKYAIPELERDVKLTINGREVVIPMAEAQKLIDMDVPDLVPYDTMSGFRFDDEAQVVKLKDGTVIEARVRDLMLDAGPGTKRISGDIIAVHDAPGRPMLGTIEVQADGGRTTGVDVRYVDTITQGADGKVTVKMRDDYQGWPKQLTGTLQTDVPWDRAVDQGGRRVLKQTDDFIIRGGFTLELLDGTTQRVNASEVSQILGEAQKDLRISQFSVWVAENKGMFATDGSTGVVVSNGMRWVNRLDITQHTDDVRPDWAPKGQLLGLNGELVRQEGDKVVWLRAMAAAEKGKEINSTLYAGWMQVDADGRIVNEGFTSGQPDFGWSGDGSLNWLAKSSFNPYMDPELRLRIFVNGVADQAKLEKMAADGNLPADWRNYLER